MIISNITTISNNEGNYLSKLVPPMVEPAAEESAADKRASGFLFPLYQEFVGNVTSRSEVKCGVQPLYITTLSQLVAEISGHHKPT